MLCVQDDESAPAAVAAANTSVGSMDLEVEVAALNARATAVLDGSGDGEEGGAAGALGFVKGGVEQDGAPVAAAVAVEAEAEADDGYLSDE